MRYSLIPVSEGFCRVSRTVINAAHNFHRSLRNQSSDDLRRTKREALEDQVPEATRAVGCLSGDLVEEVAEHDALAQKFLQGGRDILLQVVEGGGGVCSAKFLLICLEGSENCGREHLAFLRAQEKPK